MMKFRIFAIVLLGLSFFSSAQAQTNQPCGCEHKADLLKALNMTQMAIQELNIQKELLKDREILSGKIEMFSDDAYKELAENLKKILDMSSLKMDSLSGNFELNRVDCSLKEKETRNECLRQIEKKRMDVYKRACDETKNVSIEQNPYHKMSQVILQEISAYQEMQNFILRMLKALPKTCRPNNWFGYVSYRKISTLTSVKNIPAQTGPMKTGSLTTGGNVTEGISDSYYGTIIVEEGKGVNALAQTTWLLQYSRIAHGRLYCSKANPDQMITETSKKSQNGEGGGSGKPDFRLNVQPNQGKYNLSISFFPVKGLLMTNQSGNTKGGCKQEPWSNSTPLVEMSFDAPSPASVEWEIEPNTPDILQGTKTSKPENFNRSYQEGNTSLTKTYETQIRWMLRRLPAK